MTYLPVRYDTVHFGFHDAGLDPVLDIASGREVVVSTVSAYPEHDVPAQWLPRQIHDIFAPVKRGTGYGHATQSDGEVIRTAIETSFDGHFRLSFQSDLSIEWPLAVTPDHLMTMALHDDAARIAMRTMIGLLDVTMRVTRFANGNRAHPCSTRPICCGSCHARSIFSRGCLQSYHGRASSCH